MDIYQKSTFFHKDRGGKLRAGPVCDFNLAFGYDFGSVGRSGHDVLQFANGDNTGSDFWHQLYEDNFFRCYLMHRWEELTSPGAPLHYDSVTCVMDSLITQISNAVSRDRMCWWRFYDYNEHINTMKTWLQHRYAWLNHEWDLYRDCIPIEPLPLVISMINYHPASQLGINADGHGDFLILLDPDLDNALPESWISADNFVGVPDRALSATLTVSPNPTTRIVRIESSEPMASLTLTDAQGRTLTHKAANGDTALALDLTPYPVGIYFVTAEVRNGAKATTKVVRKL